MKSTIGKIFAAATLLLALFFYFHRYNSEESSKHTITRTPLERAITLGDTQAVEKILQSNPSLANKRNSLNDTPLNLAVRCQQPKETVELLLKYGADINAKGKPFDTTPLQAAAWNGNTEVVKVLLAHHPDVNALQNHMANTPTGKVSMENNETALNYAFVADNKEIFNLLLAAGADINRGRSTLSECMNYAEPSMKGWAEFLLSKGADPNRVGTDRFAPLIQAIISGRTDDVAALLRYHVDTTVKYINGGEDYTPLELALYEDNPKIADLLYSQNTDLNSKDNKGRTPLQRAVQKGQKQSVEWLLKHGAKE